MTPSKALRFKLDCKSASGSQKTNPDIKAMLGFVSRDAMIQRTRLSSAMVQSASIPASRSSTRAGKLQGLTMGAPCEGMMGSR